MTRFEIQNTVALVTGTNKPRGIGRAIVEELLAAGAAKVYATARSKAQLQDLVDRHGDRVSPANVELQLDRPSANFTQVAAFDVFDDDGKPVRGEVGELLVRLPERPLTPATEFRGYTDESASQKKVLTDVFLKGDRYFRSGDLLRFDEDDFFYFVDRIGDTYRWKGENVSTAEVADVLTSASSIAEATVVGVRVPGNEGQAGLAAVVLEPGSAFDADAFWKTAQELPSYAQPRFVRVLSSLATTGTFKIQKNGLRNEGVDPSQVTDPLFVRSDAGYLPLDATTWGDVTEGRFRL